MEEKKSVAPIDPPATAQAVAQAIEAILYAAGHPMRYEKIAEVLGLSTKDVKAMVRQMADHFA